MSTTNWTTADLAALEKAIASGVSRVKYQDKEVNYRSIEEMFKARDMIKKALGLTAKSQRIYTSFSKGTS